MTDMESEPYIEHIGIKRRSGRYPWGSGRDPYQRSMEFKAYYSDLKSQGLTDPQIAKGIEEHINANRKPSEHWLSFKTTDLRAAIGNSTEEIRANNIATASRLKNERQMSNVAIAKKMNTNESTVRGWLKATDDIIDRSIRAVAEKIKEVLHQDPSPDAILDVGFGTHLFMGISETRLRTALSSLRDEGYEQYSIKLPQLGTDKMTDYKILTKPGVTWHDARAALAEGRHRTIDDVYSPDGGLTFHKPKPEPVSVNSKRLAIRYKEDGGDKMDGVIELRRGVEDLSLQGKNYAQVRVAVDGTHYLKGMAMYADDLPDGVDIRFNTPKSKDEFTNKLDALKPLKLNAEGKVDGDNPFGATTYPRTYVDKKGVEQTSPLRIVNEEGRWDEWSRALSSQMASKQPIKLAKAQLAKAQEAKQKDLAEIMALTNPVVKKKLLDEFADSADAAAVHLKAAAMDRQTTAVILPMNTVKPNQIYAPNHEHGEKVVLVRHPHGGPFEIPELTVNNNNREARRLLGSAKDAVGIHHSVAEQLSGADFDGDSVLVIPNNDRAIKTRPPLEGLKGFNPREIYKIPDDDTKTPRMSKANTQLEMGKISNLITDMTIRNASDAELTRAIKHSMVVIDAEKHGLNYKESERQHNIKQLKEKYQGINPVTGQPKGAATLISRASADARVPEIKLRAAKDGGPVDPKTGELVYVPTGRTTTKVETKTYKRTGETVTKVSEIPRLTKGTRMEFAKDARDLLSDKDNAQPMEELYASHANTMKALANEARKTAHPQNLRMPTRSKAAAAMYANEVASLEAKLKIAQRNAPIERKAQAIGNAIAKARIDANPAYDKDDKKKIQYQELERARITTGASKKRIGSEDSPLTEREWEAIQAGAVSASKLREILSNADMERVRTLATPKRTTYLTPGQIARARSLTNAGRPLSEVAALLGIPRSTLSDNLANN